MIHEISPPPTEYDYTDVAHRLDDNFAKRPMNRVLADKLEWLPQRDVRAYMARAAEWGLIIEPHDRSLGMVDKGRLTANIFTQGSAAGLVFVDRVHHGVVKGSQMVDYFDTLKSSTSSDDRDHEKHLLAEEIIELSELGLMAIGEQAGEVIEGWEERCTPNISKQIMFRRGIGMAVFLANRIHTDIYSKQERAVLQRQADNAKNGTVDWDVALLSINSL